MDLLLGWLETIDQQYLRYGAIVIDATQPPPVVVDEILRLGAIRA